MTDERFEELVNLYLDREINADEFRELSSAISASDQRKARMVEAYRIHQALIAASGGRHGEIGSSHRQHAQAAKRPLESLYRAVNFTAASAAVVAIMIGGLLLSLSAVLEPFPADNGGVNASGNGLIPGDDMYLTHHRYTAARERERQRQRDAVLRQRQVQKADFRSKQREYWIDRRFVEPNQRQEERRRQLEPFSVDLSFDSRVPKSGGDSFRASLIDYGSPRR